MTSLLDSRVSTRCSQSSSATSGAEMCAWKQDSSRRRFIQLTMGAAAGLVAVGLEVATPRPALAQSKLSPDAALQELMAGNRRFAAGHSTACEKDLATLRKATEEKQEPFSAVLACADSRVPVELVFDQSIGHIFVCRVAGNVCTPEVIASLEYGAAVLSVPVIMVLGHDGCGAVKASIDAKPVPGQISALYAPLRPAVERAGPDLTATIKANARIQADLLRAAYRPSRHWSRTAK